MCVKAAGKLSEAVSLFTVLYETTVRTAGLASQNAVGVARTLCELHDEVWGPSISRGRGPGEDCAHDIRTGLECGSSHVLCCVLCRLLSCVLCRLLSYALCCLLFAVLR